MRRRSRRTAGSVPSDQMIVEFEKSIQEYAVSFGDNYKYAQGVLDDVAGLNVVLELVKEGKQTAAYNAAYNLDSIVRDEIPNKVWRWISDFPIKRNARS